MHGLNTYDYGARQYDPARITWDRMDQLCEKKPWNNPYVFCGANPINRIDKDGMADYEINNQGYFHEMTGLLHWLMNLFNSSNNDRIYKHGEDKPIATLKKNSIKLKCNSEKKVCVEIENSKEADKFRDAVMKNSDVEWCRVEATDEESTTNIFLTNYDKETVNVDDAMKQLGKEKKSITKVEHSHVPLFENQYPENIQSNEDYKLAVQHPKAVHIVYNKQKMRKEYYNGKDIYKTEPWK